MNPSTRDLPLASPVEKVEDLRQPVGLDAGAPEVTDAAEDVGGWHGGAEENNKREQEVLGNVEEQVVAPEPKVEEVKVERMEVDDEARRLADAALRADEDV